jgi:phosphoribosylanthranilate isomerase
MMETMEQPSAKPSADHAPALRRRTRIKICGIRDEVTAQAAVDAGVDAIGLVFAPASPRYVLPGPAQRIARSLPPLVSAIGVFQNPSDPDLQNWRGQWVQMHGQETEAQLARVAANRRIIKGFHFDRAQIERWNTCPSVSALLIDGPASGSGITFDHELLLEMKPRLNTPVILAGGLTPETVGRAVSLVHPFGVDVSSGVERERGVKDAGLIREFCAAVREADASA